MRQERGVTGDTVAPRRLRRPFPGDTDVLGIHSSR